MIIRLVEKYDFDEIEVRGTDAGLVAVEQTEGFAILFVQVADLFPTSLGPYHVSYVTTEYT